MVEYWITNSVEVISVGATAKTRDDEGAGRRTGVLLGRRWTRKFPIADANQFCAPAYSIPMRAQEMNKTNFILIWSKSE